MANDPANALDVARDMRHYIDDRRERARAVQQAGDGKRKREEGVRKAKGKPSAKKVVTDEDNPTVMQNPAAQLGPAWAGATAPLTRALPVTQERVQARTADDRFC